MKECGRMNENEGSCPWRCILDAFLMFLMFHVAIWLICFVSSVEVSQLEQSLQKGELTLAELWYRSQPSMDTFALLQHGSVSSVCLKLDRQAKWPSLYPNLQDFPRKTRNQRMKEDDVGDFNATWPRYRITSHVQGLKGGAVLNGTMAVELFEEVVCLCHDSSWVVLSYPFLLAGFKMTDKRNSFDKVWIDLQGKSRCEQDNWLNAHHSNV